MTSRDFSEENPAFAIPPEDLGLVLGGQPEVLNSPKRRSIRYPPNRCRAVGVPLFRPVRYLEEGLPDPNLLFDVDRDSYSLSSRDTRTWCSGAGQPG